MSSVAPDGRAVATRGAWLDNERPQRQSHARHEVSSISTLFVLGATVLLIGLAVAMATTTYDIWGGLVVGSVLLVLTIPLATRAARRANDPELGRFILLAAFARLSVGVGCRYLFAYYLYQTSDAERYFTAGASLAPHIRHGDFAFASGTAGSAASHFLESVSGVVIAIIGESRVGEFVVFSWMSFLGLYLFYQAFRIAFPEGDHRRYRLLIFFWPSLLFWPSSVGKDAWMVWMLGMCALGVAQLFVGRWRGFIWLGVGSFGCVMVRPHLALMVAAAFGLGLVLRRNRGTYARMLAQPLGTVVLLVGIILAGGVMFQQTQTFFKLDSLDLESVQGVLGSTSLQTSEGGTSFTPTSPNSPVGYVQSTITVMFRPFPTEVRGAALATGLEGVLLAGLVVVSRRRIMRVLRMSLRHAYVAFAVGYSFVFIFAYASISNFGILARERSQFFPVLFVLLAIPQGQQESEDEIDDTALLTAT